MSKARALTPPALTSQTASCAIRSALVNAVWKWVAITTTIMAIHMTTGIPMSMIITTIITQNIPMPITRMGLKA